MPCFRQTSTTFVSFAAASLRMLTICSAEKRDVFMSPPPLRGSGLSTYSLTPLTGRRPYPPSSSCFHRGQYCVLLSIEPVVGPAAELLPYTVDKLVPERSRILRSRWKLLIVVKTHTNPDVTDPISRTM